MENAPSSTKLMALDLETSINGFVIIKLSLNGSY